jgi:hypothetical protein
VSTLPEIDGAVRRLFGESEVATDLDAPATRQFVLGNDRTTGVYWISGDGHTTRTATDLETLLQHLVEAINAEAIARFTGFAAHAGVVADEGNAIAFLAPSGGGKSTIVAASLTAGFRYVSDEALCVAYESESVIPYPKPLQLSSRSCEALGLSFTGTIDAGATLSPADIGGLVASGRLEPAHVVQLVRRDGPATLCEAPRIEGVVWLLERSFNHFKRPAESFVVATALATRCRTWQLEYDDAREAVGLVARHLSNAPGG